MIFTAAQLTAMKAAQTGHMNDSVNITNITVYTDNYGDTVYSGVVQSGVACGFDFTGGMENDKGEYILVNYDADLRLPLTTTIGINDKVELISLAGVTHSGEMFEVYQYPRFGTTVKNTHLKRRSN
jgi:hypothetical protein